jgi:nucleotide-binding universal stress UspA family protein
MTLAPEDTLMNVKTILHPTDGSPNADKALALACDLALAKNAHLLLLHVQRRHGGDRIPPDLVEYSRWEQVQETEAEVIRSAAHNIGARADKEARRQGVAPIETIIIEGDPSGKIAEVAKDRNVDMIVMGSRGLGDLQGLLLGSVSHKVASSSPCTCIIVR